MRKFEYKYKIDEEHKTVVAMSTFAGRPVAGVAKCSPEDAFDVNAGKNLAAARCALKVAKRRMKRAAACLVSATSMLEYFSDRVEKMKHYNTDAKVGYEQALAKLVELEDAFNV